MFRPARWRTDKNRVKAVFKLQFHVTQMLQSGVDALVLSIVPVDIGKATTRLDKASVNGGICRWDNPVYETVKFVQDSKTAKFAERIYYFVLSTGLSKASTIGEVSIDFADYAEATKPSSVSLPFKNSRCDAVLHVSIQRLQENNDKREEEECEDGKIKPDANNNNNKSLRTYLTNGHADEIVRSDSYEDVSAKSNSRGAELSADCRTSSGSDLTLSSSEGSGGLDTPREHGVRNAGILPNTNGFVSPAGQPPDPQNPAVNATAYDVHQRSQWGWLAASEHGLSTDDSTNDSQDALPKEGSQPAADTEIERLKAELTAVARQKDMSDLELQTLKKQIIKESKKGQELSKEIMSLKEERDALKTECENLKSFHKRMEEAKASTKSLLDTGDLRTLVEEIRQELNYEKDLNANLRLQLNKTQESNAELVLAVQDLDEMLEQKNKEIYNLSNNHEPSKNSHEMGRKSFKYETEDDEDQKELEELAKEHSDAKETHLLEQKILDLYGEIELYKRDKDELEMQMEQLALDYEILKQENHDIAYKLEQNQLQEQLKIQYECSSPPPAIDGIESHTENLENQLKNQSEELSNYLATIKELEAQVCKLEAQVSRLEEEMKKQARGFEADLDSLIRDKAEQEQRAIQAEEALRKSRCTESHIKSLESQLMKESEDLSNSLATIKILEAQISRLEEQLEKQADEFEVDLDAVTREKIEQEQRAIQAEEALQNIRSTENRIQSLENQLMKQSEELSNSEATVKVLEAQISRLEEEMEKQASGFEAELDAVMCDKIEQEQRAINAEEALQESRSTESRIEILENQLKKQSEELSDSLATIKVLETQISRLEEEMEKQAHGFETDLDAVTRDKIEQEQRAIRAEEVLRKTRLKNAKTAEKLQEEFKRLSVQMASTFDANEKATMRAMKEASELRARKRLVEQMLDKVKEELHSVKSDYEVKLNELSNQIDAMTVKMQQMSLEIEDKSRQLENQKAHDEQVSSDFSEETRNLKAENERLKAEISCFLEQVEQKETLRTELEAMKKSVEESETLSQRKTVERNELVSTIVLLKEEAEQLLDELSKMRDLKDEKETVSRLLQSELDELKAQYGALKNSLSEEEAEIEKLRKQIFQLKGELKKKDDALANNEKKLKDRNGDTQVSGGAKTSPKNKKSAPNPQNSKEMASLREKVKLLEALIKSKETALETSTSSFLEKERELQSKIEELEDKVEEFSQSIALQKVIEDKCVTVEPPNDSTCVSGQNDAAALSLSTSDSNSSEKEELLSRMDHGDGNLSDMLTEFSLLKERNKSMENELKEMQERYSEMSLKFAEVEGERQKLVMTVRSLKNSRKGGHQ